MDKKIVHYLKGSVEIHQWEPCGDTEEQFVLVAGLYALDHPKLGAGEIRTSRIVNLDTQTGIIETLNTMYVPYTSIQMKEDWAKTYGSND